MQLTSLVFLILFSPLGIVYLYVGAVKRDRLLAACGVAVALMPLVTSNVKVLIVMSAACTALPHIVRYMRPRKPK